MGLEPLRAMLDKLGSRSSLGRLALASRAAGLELGFLLPLCSAQTPVHHLGLAFSLGCSWARPEDLQSNHSFDIHIFSTYCVPGTDMAVKKTDLMLGKRQAKS